MDRALKVAMSVAAFVILFDLTAAIMSGQINLGLVCFLGVGFILLTGFFWLAYIVGRAIYNSEKKIWRWMNE